MTRRKEVSEKSLELSVCAELLFMIRALPGCQGAVWLGLTQQQEQQRGFDVEILNAPGVHLVLQFKAPWAKSGSPDHYRFSLNHQQHQTLLRLALSYPNAVHYVFPLYNTWGKVFRDAPRLAQDTWLAPVATVPMPYQGKERNRVDFFLQGNRRQAEVGDPEPIPTLLNASEFLGDAGASADSLASMWISGASLREWLFERTSIREPRFRSLYSIFLPQSRAPEPSPAVRLTAGGGPL